MVMGIGRGEYRLFHAAKEALAQRLVGLECRQQVFRSVIACWVDIQRLAIRYDSPFQALALQAKAEDQCMDGRKHSARNVIGIDLMTRQYEPARTCIGLTQSVCTPIVRAC